MNPKNSPTLDLKIESLSYNGGRGVGRHEGVVVFVPGTAPGDLARVRIIERKPRFMIAEVVEILSPSPSRREPPCSVAGRCGGCSWQHITYAEQVLQKQNILISSLRSVAKLGSFEVQPFLASNREFHYRNRIQVHIDGSRVGFFAKGSNDLVATRDCLVSEAALNAKLKSLSLAETGGRKRVELAIDELTESVVVRQERDPHTALFGQIHREQNEILKTKVIDCIEGKPDWAMDLYAGSGNLTFPLWDRVSPQPLLAVELSRESVDRGRKRGGKILWVAGDVGKVLAREKPRAGNGCVILDPPRPGCDKAVTDELIRLRPEQLVYVSCNPTTFARDAERLISSGQFKLLHVQGIDMFPQTEHVEMIAYLRAAT